MIIKITFHTNGYFFSRTITITTICIRISRTTTFETGISYYFIFSSSKTRTTLYLMITPLPLQTGHLSSITTVPLQIAHFILPEPPHTKHFSWYFPVLSFLQETHNFSYQNFLLFLFPPCKSIASNF